MHAEGHRFESDRLHMDRVLDLAVLLLLALGALWLTVLLIQLFETALVMMWHLVDVVWQKIKRFF